MKDFDGKDSLLTSLAGSSVHRILVLHRDPLKSYWWHTKRIRRDGRHGQYIYAGRR
jgi:hypothetical protein